MGSGCREREKHTKGAREKQHPHSRPPSSSGGTLGSIEEVPASPGAWFCGYPSGTGSFCVTGTSLSSSHAFSSSKSLFCVSLCFPFLEGVFVFVAFIVKGGTSDSISAVSWM